MGDARSQRQRYEGAVLGSNLGHRGARPAQGSQAADELDPAGQLDGYRIGRGRAGRSVCQRCRSLRRHPGSGQAVPHREEGAHGDQSSVATVVMTMSGGRYHQRLEPPWEPDWQAGVLEHLPAVGHRGAHDDDPQVEPGQGQQWMVHEAVERRMTAAAPTWRRSPCPSGEPGGRPSRCGVCPQLGVGGAGGGRRPRRGASPGSAL